MTMACGITTNLKDYSVNWGNTWTQPYKFKDVDWSTAQFWFTIKRLPDVDDTDSLAVIEKDVSDMSVVYDDTDPSNPFTLVTVFLTEPDTKSLEVGKYVYDLTFKLTGDTRLTLISGNYAIKPIVTGRSI